MTVDLPAAPPRSAMPEHVRRYRDWLDGVPGAPFYRAEFGFYCLDRWKAEGVLPDRPLAELFHFDPPATLPIWKLGWCEAAFAPAFEECVLEDRGEHELVRDFAGRHVLCFKGRRSGFMPEYVDHPVKDRRTWEADVKWRLDPATPERYAGLAETARNQWLPAVREGRVVIQHAVGGYMYLRSLLGPEELLYAFYDQPDLIHDCMETWLALALAWTERVQRHVAVDMLFLAEDICYNHGPLISPDMMREFLFPRYRALVAAMRARQPGRRLRINIDTDGFAEPVVAVYRDGVGLDIMDPWEVASGCDVVRVGRDWPDLALYGGIDKRVLAKGPAAIDEHLRRVLPAMLARGGYYPTCDHGVPEEVSFADYLHYRERCVEWGS